MRNIAILLYVGGLLGLIISIALVVINSKNKKKLITFLSFLFIVVSIGSLVSGSYLFFTNKDSDKSTSSNDKNNTDKTIKSSYDDLSFLYDLNTKSSSKIKEACITIENNSDELFSGNVPIKLLDENGNEVSSYSIPINNLLPNDSTEFNLQADSKTNSISYSFDGSFSEYDPDKEISSYVVSNLGVGNGFFRFEIITDDTSPNNLKKICKEFKDKYNKDLCNGFLIYFIKDPNEKFTDSYADFFENNAENRNLLTIYDDNSTFQID